MFKKALIGLALVTMVACGGEPTASDVGVATADLVRTPFLNPATGPSGSITHFMEQVPLGTNRLLHVGDGTYPKFFFSKGSQLKMQSGTTLAGDQDWFDTLNFIGGQDPAVGSGANDIRCGLVVGGGFSTDNNRNNVFPAGMATRSGVGFYFGFRSQAIGQCVLPAFPQFGSIQPAYTAVDYGSPNAGDNTFPNMAALHDMRVRVDLDLPSIGKTNRYFYVLTIQGG